MACHALIDELPPDARTLFLFALEHARSPTTGNLWALRADKIAKALGWDGARLRRAQDLVAETGLIEIAPKVIAPGPAWPFIRVTAAGEALGRHGFSPTEFRTKLAAAGIAVGDVNVSGSNDVTVAIGKNIHLAARPRPATPDDIDIHAYAAYSGDRVTAVALVEIVNRSEHPITLCDACLLVDPDIQLSPDPLATGLYADGYTAVGCQPITVDRFARVAWHFFDTGGRIARPLFDGPVPAVLSLRCVETGEYAVPCVVYTNSMLLARAGRR